MKAELILKLLFTSASYEIKRANARRWRSLFTEGDSFYGTVFSLHKYPAQLPLQSQVNERPSLLHLPAFIHWCKLQ